MNIFNIIINNIRQCSFLTELFKLNRNRNRKKISNNNLILILVLKLIQLNYFNIVNLNLNNICLVIVKMIAKVEEQVERRGGRGGGRKRVGKLGWWGER